MEESQNSKQKDLENWIIRSKKFTRKSQELFVWTGSWKMSWSVSDEEFSAEIR